MVTAETPTGLEDLATFEGVCRGANTSLWADVPATRNCELTDLEKTDYGCSKVRIVF